MTVSNSEVTVIVHDQDVMALLQAVELSLSPLVLTQFLEDEVQFWFEQRVEERFQNEGDDVTGPWQPLAAATQAIRASMGYGATGPINRRTGNLYEYVHNTSRAFPVPTGAMFQMPGADAQGELAVKMEHAQAGGVSESGRPFPARPVLGMNLTDLGAVLALLEKHIQRGGSLVNVI